MAHCFSAFIPPAERKNPVSIPGGPHLRILYLLSCWLRGICIRCGLNTGERRSPTGDSRGLKMTKLETFFAPEKLQGANADFYRRAITELLWYRMLRDGDDHIESLGKDRPLDPLAFDAIGIQFGQA